MLVFRDRLNRANGGIGANYTDAGAATSITSNQITFTSTAHAFYYDVATLDDTGVYVQCKSVAAPTPPGYIGMYLITAVDTTDGYYFGWDSTGATIFRVDNGVATSLGATAFTPPAGDDIVTMTYDGSNVRVYYDGTLQATRADTTYAVSSWLPFWAGLNADATIDDLECGTLTLGTVTRSVGSSGRNHSTIQAWIDECPPYLTLSNTVYKGELYNDSEFLVTAGTAVDVVGITTDSTRYLHLTTAAGQSFLDHVDAATLPLRYDTTKGVGIRVNANYQKLIYSTSVLLVEKVQLSYDTSYGSNYYPDVDFGGPSPCTLRNFILETKRNAANTIALNTGSNVIANGVICYRAASFSAKCVGINHRSSGGIVSNVTIVRDTALGSKTNLVAFGTTFGNYGVVRNCAAFGVETVFEGTLGSWTASNNASDDNGTTMAGTSNQTSLTFANQFENVTDATRDWRPKSTGALVGNGLRQFAYTGDLDVAGKWRSGTAPTIGARESTVLVKVPQPDLLLVFNEASGSTITNYGSQGASGDHTINAGSSPTDYTWSPQALSPTAGYLDLHNPGNASANLPRIQTALTAPSAGQHPICCAAGFSVDSRDTGLTRSYIVGGGNGGGSALAGIQYMLDPPTSTGDFDLVISMQTGGGYGWSQTLGTRIRIPDLDYGVLYQIAASMEFVGSSMYARYALNAAASVPLGPADNGSDSPSAFWPNLNVASVEGFTNYGGINGQLYYYAYDRDGAVWSGGDLMNINDDPSATITDWPSVALAPPFFSSGGKLITFGGKILRP